ncbi:MAG: hypothetical protein A3E98_03375 [Candidatus Doudnabacteria bacterium RIFCSPHIGHO2_12_FULL_48_11]|uniref:Uncharacterized protein n=1 Tax=Candidatus Doudnabacteria bacterium RIFCSPHIGHO2_01_FULL_46_24 TaxID=1817825 RepID=A0A1F5NT31_9BACT|nr:MAG: hypothetical protein A2720_04585 [Candidatus Doudnabacteria bacterium RIFCSPHIGHO2_01_FULL_46_24]OGE96124.1 MAG: hypothetical protein A3E98_03375 [Candidatus Doudnabacteria bacterium RIFCSPHIGHO2_12_FULL_48_11]
MKLIEWETLGPWSGNDYRSLISNLGGNENALAVKSGRLVFKITKPDTENESGEFVLEEPIKPLFDSNGRRIPPQGMKAKAVDANRSFYLDQPKVDFAARLERFVEHFGGSAFMSADEFEARFAAILCRLATDPLMANLPTHGMVLPLALPKMQIGDLGQFTDDKLLAGVKRAYEQQFPGRSFKNYREGELAKQVKVVAQSHNRLLRKLAEGSVVLGYSPNCLQGFSIPADREQMATLPADVLLCGVIEPAAALTTYPDVLARDYQTPGLDCAAVLWQSGQHSLYFRAFGDRLWFGCGDLCAYDNYSGGVCLLG